MNVVFSMLALTNKCLMVGKNRANVVDRQYVGVTELPRVQTIPDKRIALCNRKTEATFISIIANNKGHYGLFPILECF